MISVSVKVVFNGVVEGDRIEHYYEAGVIIVSASVSRTHGLTYLAALASGRPLLVRNDSCLDGVLKHGANGYGFDDGVGFEKGYRYIADSLLDKVDVGEKELWAFGQEHFAERIETVYKETIVEKWRYKDICSELAGTA